MISVTHDYGLYIFTDTLLKRASSHHKCGCDHYMIDYDIFVQPPLQDTEKVAVSNIDTSI